MLICAKREINEPCDRVIQFWREGRGGGRENTSQSAYNYTTTCALISITPLLTASERSRTFQCVDRCNPSPPYLVNSCVMQSIIIKVDISNWLICSRSHGSDRYWNRQPLDKFGCTVVYRVPRMEVSTKLEEWVKWVKIKRRIRYFPNTLRLPPFCIC